MKNILSKAMLLAIINLLLTNVSMATVDTQVHFDVDAFLKKHNIKKQENNPYFYWELAEEASTSDKFGPPNPLLILQLVSLGGHAPAEQESGRKEAQENFKNNVVKPFRIEDHITSGYGMSYVAGRNRAKKEKNDHQEYEAISRTLDRKGKRCLDRSLKSAKEFFKKRASHEEGYGGTSYGACVTESMMKQEEEYKNAMKQAQSGKIPSVKIAWDESDKGLNKTYQLLMAKVKKQKNNSSDLTVKKLKEDQNSWIKYRDGFAALLIMLNPKSNDSLWKTWLTLIRTHELETLLKDEDLSSLNRSQDTLLENGINGAAIGNHP